MSPPLVFLFSPRWGWLRTDNARPGYGRAVSPEQIIRLSAERAALRMASGKENRL